MIMLDQNVKIDAFVAVINGVTYPIKAISSIQVVQERMTSQKKVSLFAAIIGAVMLVSSQGDFGVIILGCMLTAIGIAMFLKARDDFYLKLITNAGERKVLESKDGAYLMAVRDSLVKAVSTAP